MLSQRELEVAFRGFISFIFGLFLLIVIAVATIAFFCGAAYGGGPGDSVYGLTVDEAVGESQGQSMSSCTYIGDRLFVTNWHCVSHCNGLIVVSDYGRGISYSCDIAAKSQLNDISILRSKSDVVGSFAKVSQTGVSIGEIVCGYGYGKEYASKASLVKDGVWPELVPRPIRGTVTGMSMGQHDPNRKVPAFKSVKSGYNCYFFSPITPAAIRGDSGGGVFNSNGELIAPLFGSTGSLTYATTNKALRELLEQL